MPMTTNDVRVLALLVKLDPKFLSYPDNKLLAMVYHECGHLYVRGEFKAFYDSIPSDIGIRFMVDRRTLDWMLQNKRHFLVDRGPTLAERLEHYAEANIWADTDEDEDLSYAVGDAMDAMTEAAKLLREHGLSK